MTNNNIGADSWGQLLSDFGIEDQKQKEAAPQEETKAEEPVAVVHSSAKHQEISNESVDFDDFGAGLIDSKEEIAGEPVKSKEKKSIFSRFPKVNFFGAPPQISLDSVIEGVKSPSLSGGKGFTNNKLEKMPLSQERTKRHKKDAEEEPNTWSVVASQIETLASSEDPKRKPEERPSKRHISSMFDDPIPESEESRALKTLMGEPAQSERKQRDAFLEEEPDSRRRDRGRRLPAPEERESRGRGTRYKPPVDVDDLPESEFEPVEDDTPVVRGCGGRSSRYAGGGKNRYDQGRVHETDPQEEWSEIDAALQADQEKPMQRGDRYRRDKDRRPERVKKSPVDREPVREPLDEEDSGLSYIYGNVPNWDDAIADIVLGNVSRHRNSQGKGRR